MIQVSHLRKSFGGADAVRDVSFTAPNGCITGILGENGAGKTTTLALICGLMPADGGSVHVGPESGNTLERRRHIGALLDHKGLYERLTARENIEYFGRLQGISPKVLELRVGDVVQQLGLERIADRRIAGFSQGERMKVALARAIVHAPAHVLLDEPTNGLDIPSKSLLRRVITEALTPDRVFVISTHQVRDLGALMDPIVILHQGRVLLNSTLGDIGARLHMTQQPSPPAANTPDLLFSEPAIGGFWSVWRGGGDGPLDLEVLFNAVVTQPELIRSVCAGGVA
jgi:sodium transport system ATP-binding protein